MGYKNFNKVSIPHVIPMAEEAIIALRRSHAWIAGPRYWHVTRGGHTVVKRASGRSLVLT